VKPASRKVGLLFNIYYLINDKIRSRSERERIMEAPLETFSKKMWPWPDSKLVFIIVVLACLDYISTLVFLTFGSNKLAEGGLLAGWALRTGGFPKLFLVDMAVVGALIILALNVRSFYARLGFQRMGRAAFVFILVPYFVIIIAVVYNNILSTFISYFPNF
jgi:hypothetical protein